MENFVKSSNFMDYIATVIFVNIPLRALNLIVVSERLSLIHI